MNARMIAAHLPAPLPRKRCTPQGDAPVDGPAVQGVLEGTSQCTQHTPQRTQRTSQSDAQVDGPVVQGVLEGLKLWKLAASHRPLHQHLQAVLLQPARVGEKACILLAWMHGVAAVATAAPPSPPAPPHPYTYQVPTSRSGSGHHKTSSQQQHNSSRTRCQCPAASATRWCLRASSQSAHICRWLAIW